MLDLLGLGPITIGTPAYDRAFDNHRGRASRSCRAARHGRCARRWPRTRTRRCRRRPTWIDTRATSLDQLLAIFYVLLALAVIVSLFGIVNTLVLSTFERTRELGMLRAVGMTRRQMRRMVRHESIITAPLGAVTGIALGLGLAAIVVAVARRRRADLRGPGRLAGRVRGRRGGRGRARGGRPGPPRCEDEPHGGLPTPELVLGTAGHIDHGKTALVRALTGVDTDRLPEERARGISIALGYARLEPPSGRALSVVDVPGHERFVRTMVAGATGIDLFLLSSPPTTG